MRLSFVKMNPAGNTTVYIFDQLPREVHAEVGQRLMSHGCLCADQVGFVEKPANREAVARLQMMGGEFCGNATRALAALLAARGYPGVNFDPSGHASVPLEVSGYNHILQATVARRGDKLWAEAPIPAPESVRPVSFQTAGGSLAGTIVEIPGIVHVVLEDTEPSAETFHSVRQQLGCGADALGVMFYDTQKDFLTPLVYVTGPGTLIWEGSCGSGSVAVAAALATGRKDSVSGLLLRQPGGDIEVDIDYHAGRINGARIKGSVEYVAEGTVEI